MSRLAPAAALLLLLGLTTPPLATPSWSQGGAPSGSPSDSFGEEISVTEVEIPVRVLRHGEPLRGLTVEDFVATEGDEHLEVVGFRVIDLALPDTSAGPAESGDRTAGARSAAEPTDGRNILLLFDFVFSRNQKLRQALTGAREMLAHQLHPADRIAVAYLTGRGANLLLGFSGDRREIDLALGVVDDLLEHRPKRARKRMAELGGAREPQTTGADGAGRQAADPSRSRVAELDARFGAAAAVAMLAGTGAGTASTSIGDSRFGSGPWGGAAGAEVEGGFSDPTVSRIGSADDPFAIGRSLAAAGESSAIRTVTREVERLATLLRSVRGQREMLYLSEGFSSSILNSFDSPYRAVVLRQLERMFESLRRSGWTLHSVDIGGIPGLGERGFDADSLFYMANETGGHLLENYNRIHLATERLLEKTSVTYVLTVRSRELEANGRYHRVQVRLAEPRPGVRILHRPGYYAPKPAQDRSALEQRLDAADLLLGEREVDQLQARVMAGALPPLDGGRSGGPSAGPSTGLAPVPVVVEVPTRDLGPDAGRLDLELQAFAVDSHGGVQDLWLRRIALDREGAAGETLARGGVRVLGALALPPGEYRVRVLVRWLGADRMSLSTVPLAVPAAADRPLPLDPVVVDRSGDWLELLALPEGPGAAAADGFSLGGRPVVPPTRPVIPAGGGLELLVPVDPGAADAAGRGGAGLELTGRVLDSGGRPVTAALELVPPRGLDRGGRLEVYHGWLAAGGLAPGDYRLEVTATRGDGGAPASRSLAFSIRE